MQAKGRTKPTNQRRHSSLALTLGAVLVPAVLLAGCATKVEVLGICRLPTSGQILPDISKDNCTAREGKWAEEVMATAYAEPPAGATVDSVPMAAWNAAICGDTSVIDVPVKSGAWIEWKIGWTAVDTTTARANWDSISYQLLYDDTLAVDLSNSLAWRTDSLNLKCPDKTYTGILSSRAVYLRPPAKEQRVTGVYNFLGSTNDGWSSFERGTSINLRAVLRPRS